MSFSSGYALLIGVGTYRHHPHLNLRVTVADAQSLATVLCDPQVAGYPADQVTVLHDDTATRDGILAALATLATRTTADSTVVLYYAGHGYYDRDQVYYLTSHDTQLDEQWLARDTGGVRQDDVLRALQAIPAKRMLLLFNACHAGEMSPTLEVTPEPTFLGINPPATATAALLGTGDGRIIITACRATQVSQTGGGSTTVFARAITDALQGQEVPNRDGYISAFDLYTTVYTNVRERVRQRQFQIQEPELTVLKGVGPFAVSLYPGSQATTPPAILGGALAPHEAIRTLSSDETQTALQQLLGGLPRIQIGDTHATNTSMTGDSVTINQSRTAIKMDGALIRGQVTISDVTVGNKIIQTITITPQMVAAVASKAELLVMLDQLKQSVGALQQVDSDSQQDAVDDIQKAKEAAEKGKMERLIEKLTNVKNVMVAFAANAPVAHQLGQTIGEIIQKAHLLK
jgi:hypothetical protein